ncbi:phosphoribosylglycinamide formyltransferase [Loigolactobacillus bifermentans]|jgi:phosphoribosylglycinamide formyltransferase-1|uniref:Phosphoribosylglycinamide formyltransferase n=1 Tax=Loigolactobacillus bifermentans DSM 20003 TaxID=1423726 RepID=A0A0R1GRT8_9LACO|nr:phosphoribosylglycinamide formyltransferase [Loigolactobacillus bifermentans]KRK34138.1 phosphoribosylglycinamide formyltransferase [Loigolactobacillus bifermentans DSM 20003]QGG59258.1 phosphoribosylglycinamide formyltransferase [Loigolactobacillus bifermentans]
MIKVAIFASGTGTNFDALLAHIQASDLPIQVGLLVSDQPQALVVAKAQQAGVPVWAKKVKDFADKTAFEQAILQQLQTAQIDWILLAGYMRIVTPVLLNAYPQHILNIHPALLPLFPGRHGIEDAYAAGVSETGVTVHYIDAGIDSGPILAQAHVAILKHETVAHLAQRIHQVEHRLFFDSFVQALVAQGDLTVHQTQLDSRS